MCKYDDERHSWEQRDWKMHLGSTGWKCRFGEQQGRLEFGSTGSGFVNLVLHSRISPQKSRISEALLCHFSSTTWVVTVKLLTRGEKNVHLVRFEDIVIARPAK